jgi:hypothetical protein
MTFKGSTCPTCKRTDCLTASEFDAKAQVEANLSPKTMKIVEKPVHKGTSKTLTERDMRELKK